MFASFLLSTLLAPTTPLADPFSTPKEGLTIAVDAQGGPTMNQILADFERVTGQHLVVSPQNAALLEKTQSGLMSTLQVPAGEVYFVVETLLAQNGFVVTLANDREPRMMTVHSIQGAATAMRAGAWTIAVGEIEAYARHPALLVTTTIELDALDVRVLSNSMRSMFTDANTQQIIPLGNSDSLVMTGTATGIASMIKMLQGANAAARKSNERAEKRVRAEAQPSVESKEAAGDKTQESKPEPKPK